MIAWVVALLYKVPLLNVPFGIEYKDSGYSPFELSTLHSLNPWKYFPFSVQFLNNIPNLTVLPVSLIKSAGWT